MKDEFAKYAVNEPDEFEKYAVHNGEKISEQSFLNKLPRNIATGLAEAGRHLLNLPGALHLPYAPHFDTSKSYAKEFGLQGRPTLSDQMIQSLSQFIPSLIAPEASLGEAGQLLSKIPYAGKLLKGIAGNAVYPAAYSATQAEENPGQEALMTGAATAPFSALLHGVSGRNPLLSLAGRAGLGALGGYAGYEGAKNLGLPEIAALGAAGIGASLGGLGKNPKIEARKKMLEGIEGTNYKDTLEAAKRLGLSHITPAEASGSPFVSAKEGALGKTKEGALRLHEAGQKRLQTEKESISRLFNDIYNPTQLEEKKNELYSHANKKIIPENEMEQFKDNEIIKRAKKIVENNPAYRENLKGVDKNSIEYLHNIKTALDKMIKVAKNAGGEHSHEATLIKDSQNKLLKEMDRVSPEYKMARQLAERKINRRKLEESMNEDEIKGTSFFSKALKNDKSFDKLKHGLRNVPAAQSQLEDMRIVFKNLINPPSLRTAAGFVKAGMNQERNTKKAFGEALKELFNFKAFDKSAVELITNPKWADEIHKLKKSTSYESKLHGMLNLMKKAAIVGVSPKNNAGAQ